MPQKEVSNLRTLINFILDKSGSMSMRRDATISGFNEYLKTVKGESKKDKSETLFSLTMFDTAIVKPYVAVKLSEVKELDQGTYAPDGMTALYDAVCMTVKEVEEKIKKMKGKTAVVTVILTDGEENSSREYTQKELSDKIKELQKANWSFVFLGANQDSWATAQSWGIHAGNIANFSMANDGTVKNAFNSVARGTAMAMSVTADLGDNASWNTSDFFQGQKDASEDR